MHPNFAGALLNSALYLLSVLVVAIVTGHPMAWKVAIAALAVTYLSHVAQFTAAQWREPAILWLANVLVAMSIMLGLVAGLALLF